MTDFAMARVNMVESQIRPNKVTDAGIIDAMSALPRERFVGQDMRGLAYLDEDLPIAAGRYLMEPMVLARLLQAARPGSTDIALDIACGTGYSTAIIARHCATVVALECDKTLADQGNEILNDLGIDNAVVVHGELSAGYPKQAPYDVIVFGGAVSEVPGAVLEQLAEGGRLVAVLRGKDGIGRAHLAQRIGGVVSRRVLFDASIPTLPGFEHQAGFVF